MLPYVCYPLTLTQYKNCTYRIQVTIVISIMIYKVVHNTLYILQSEKHRSFHAYVLISIGSSVYVCQNQVSYIGCPKNSKLRVAYANYGRTDNHICPVQGSKPNTNCISSTSLAKTKWNCNGYSLCKLSPSDAVFGDPCPDTWKYIHVRFDCVNDAGNLGISKRGVFFYNNHIYFFHSKV